LISVNLRPHSLVSELATKHVGVLPVNQHSPVYGALLRSPATSSPGGPHRSRPPPTAPGPRPPLQVPVHRSKPPSRGRLMSSIATAWDDPETGAASFARESDFIAGRLSPLQAPARHSRPPPTAPSPRLGGVLCQAPLLHGTTPRRGLRALHAKRDPCPPLQAPVSGAPDPGHP
jgi:hypothetical protein